MDVRVRVIVEGLVQGVFFRVSAAEEARRAGVGGWVRNLPDGRVEAVFEGDRSMVDALVEWCRHGPAYAAVERVDLSEEPPVGEQAFSIR